MFVYEFFFVKSIVILGKKLKLILFNIYFLLVLDVI